MRVCSAARMQCAMLAVLRARSAESAFPCWHASLYLANVSGARCVSGRRLCGSAKGRSEQQVCGRRSVASTKDAATTHVLVVVSVDWCKDTATAIFLSGVSAARWRDISNAKFSAGVSVARCRDAAITTFRRRRFSGSLGGRGERQLSGRSFRCSLQGCSYCQFSAGVSAACREDGHELS